MGSVCRPQTVLEENNYPGAIIFRNKANISGNILVGDCGKCIYTRVRRYNRFLDALAQRPVSRSVPIVISNEEKSVHEDYVNKFRTLSPPGLFNNEQSVRSKKVYSSYRLQPPVSYSFRYPKRNSTSRTQKQMFSD